MDVRNCRKCGRIFNYVVGQNICPVCRDKLEDQFKQVKEYIRDNRTCSVAEVVEACGVERNQIQQWIREERLEFSGGIGAATCEKCGASISTGRFCEKCKLNMANTFSEASGKSKPQMPQQDEKKEGIRMHYLDR